MKNGCHDTLKVLHVITGLYTGGAEKALYNLLSGGLAERFDSHVISLIDEGAIGPQIRDLQIPVTILGMRGGRPSVSGLIKLRQVVRRCKPDIIQGWMYHGNLAATLARAFSPERPVLTWNIRQSLYDLNYEKTMTQKIIRLNRFFSKYPQALLYNSHLSRQQHEEFGFTSLHGKVIPNGIDTQRFAFSPALRLSVRTELNIPVEARVIGHIARLHPMKDHSMFLRVATALALRYPDVHYLLSGKGVSFDNKSLIQLIPGEVLDRFHLLGERSDVQGLMNAMNIFCLSSAWGEGFPNVIGEAMATGVPCVATDVGDSAVIVGDTGVIVPPRNENALSAGIEKLLTIPLDQLNALGRSARLRIETKFTLGSVVDQYATLYESLVSTV